jgi:hypothetical protein
MTGYPIAWDYEESGEAAPDQRGPYSAAEMQQYLFVQHYHWSTAERPLELTPPVLLVERDTQGRHLWLWAMQDQTGRIWHVIVGSGRSPFSNEDRHCHRFMYAIEDEGEMPIEVLLRQARQLES